MERGVVKSFNHVSDYGFIAPDVAGQDRYMHGKDFAGPSSTLRKGLRVAFEPRDGGMGAEAIKVRRVDAIRRRSTGSFEPARRRGPFDPRFPRGHAAAPSPRIAGEHGDGGLNWCAFEARYFPDRARHDLHALKAFESYGKTSSTRHTPDQQAEWRPNGSTLTSGLPHPSGTPGARGYRRLPVAKTPKALQSFEGVAPAAVSAWEWEGGAMPPQEHGEARIEHPRSRRC